MRLKENVTRELRDRKNRGWVTHLVWGAPEVTKAWAALGRHQWRNRAPKMAPSTWEITYETKTGLVILLVTTMAALMAADSFEKHRQGRRAG
jgi:hypothetical protein